MANYLDLYLRNTEPRDPTPHWKSLILCFFCLTDDYVAIGADCEHIAAQIEEYILTNGASSRACVPPGHEINVLGGKMGQSFFA